MSIRVSVFSLLQRLEVDRAVFFGVLAKIWALCSGSVTLLLIMARFNPEVQGYYYTFGTIVALEVFVELGLGTVIIQFASHEWAHLRLDASGSIAGDERALSRLASIARIATVWYAVGAVLLMLGLPIGGYMFFSASPSHQVDWLAPWLSLSFLAGINLLLVPVWSLLEGCNQVTALYTFRFVQAAMSGIAMWVAIMLGANLWCSSVFSLVNILCGVFFLRSKYWFFFKSLLHSTRNGPRVNWRRHLLPLQWRIALSWASGYFVFSLFTPVLFRYHGPVIAGRFGMTWSAIGLLSAISSSWLMPRVPQLGMLIAQRKYGELDRLFWKLAKLVAGITVLMAFAVWLVVYLLNSVESLLKLGFASRFLPPMPTALFLAAQVIVILSMPFSSYMRAHKQEPIVHISVLAAVLAGLSTFILGKYYSVMGMAVGYLAVNALVIPLVILVWFRSRNAWHASADQSATLSS
jgi:O-antigen/teichoic acid export membrane protein